MQTGPLHEGGQADRGGHLPRMRCRRGVVYQQHGVTRRDEERGDADGDRVEHDGGDHFVCPGACLEDTRDESPHHPPDDTGGEDERHREQRRCAGQPAPRPDPRGGERAEQQLALGPDVEQPGFEAERDREGADDERGRPRHGGRDPVRAAEGALEECAIGDKGVSSRTEDEEASHQARDEDREERHGHRCQPEVRLEQGPPRRRRRR